MKFINLLLLGPIILTSCVKQVKEQNEYIFNEGPVIVAGQLENADSIRVELTILELTGRVEHVTKTDKNGCFQFDVEVLSAHDNYFHAGQLTSIYLEPNDSIFITGDAQNIKKTINFSGSNAKINTSLKEFSNELGKRLTAEEYFYKYTKMAETPVSPLEYKNIINNFFDSMTLFVDSIAIAQMYEKRTINWMKAYIKYREAEEIMEYMEDYEDELPEGYAYFEDPEFLKRGDTDFQCSQYYEDFLESYYLVYLLSKVDGYGKAMSGYQEITYSGLDIALNFFNENITDTLYKNLFLTMICNSLIPFDYQLIDSIYPVYSQLVNDITCQNFIQRLITNEKAEPSKVFTLNELASKQYIGDIFQEIENACNGKVIYIDVWGTWCGGCVNALSYTNKLHNDLNDNNIEFVYLCLMSKKSDWEEIRKERDLKGLHYLLGKEQYMELGDLLNTYGIPRYIIIDKNGNIVDDNAKPPYSRALKNELLALIE